MGTTINRVEGSRLRILDLGFRVVGSTNEPPCESDRSVEWGSSACRQKSGHHT